MNEKLKDGETVSDVRIERRNARKSAKDGVKTERLIRDGIGGEDDFTFSRRRNEAAMEDIDGADEY